ncbi:MAG: hypothetical protein RLZZ450_6958 [Pseudomonadota bacterium]|jgi:Mg-chelatase subunit ChlD
MKKCGLLLTILAITSCGNDDPLRSGAVEPSNTGARDAGSTTATVRDAGRSSTPSTGKPTTSGNASADAASGAGVCESFQITSGHAVPDMLIVLDRSGSMKMGNVNRWDPSVAGITAITAELDSSIRFGLMAFPGSGGMGGGGGVRCAPGTLEVPIDLETGPTIATKLKGFMLIDSTPTASTLVEARKVLNAIEAPSDFGVKGTPYVVLVTDGAPNCSVDNGSGRGNAGFDQTAFEDTITAIKALASDGIKTYVLGYDADKDAQLKQSLDAMAVAGNTGDTMARAVDNEAALVTAFKAIAGTAISCDFKLDEAPSDPSYVLVKVGNQPVRYNDVNGWKLSDDKRTLTLQGKSCSDLSRVEGTAVSVEVLCTVVQVI